MFDNIPWKQSAASHWSVPPLALVLTLECSPLHMCSHWSVPPLLHLCSQVQRCKGNAYKTERLPSWCDRVLYLSNLPLKQVGPFRIHWLVIAPHPSQVADTEALWAITIFHCSHP